MENKELLEEKQPNLYIMNLSVKDFVKEDELNNGIKVPPSSNERPLSSILERMNSDHISGIYHEIEERNSIVKIFENHKVDLPKICD